MNLIQSHDIIVAISTPPGRGGIGVVRISGSKLTPFTQTILGYHPRARYAHLSKFYDEKGHVIDQGVALYYPAPNSYTGEDVLELQGHGNPVILNMLLATCLAIGARLARPGEFTLRAFLNSKLDLVQAESVAEIINASTNQAARCAVRSLQGEFSVTIRALVASITKLRMQVEATLDFPDEETDSLSLEALACKTNQILEKLTQIFQYSKQGNLLQEGINVVLVGKPNVGKSSLMNQLMGEEVAIVTEIAGTTRDTVQKTIQIDGVPIHLIDTAGLRETKDVVEQSGIARTHAAIKKADILLLLIDSSWKENRKYYRSDGLLPSTVPRIIIRNKNDLLEEPSRICEESGELTIYLSAKTGDGISLLRRELLKKSGWNSVSAGEGSFMARQRHLQALTNAKNNLESAKILLADENHLELFAEELRLSQQALSSITGEVTADDLLGEIFSHFCIGK